MHGSRYWYRITEAAEGSALRMLLDESTPADGLLLSCAVQNVWLLVEGGVVSAFGQNSDGNIVPRSIPGGRVGQTHAVLAELAKSRLFAHACFCT